MLGWVVFYHTSSTPQRSVFFERMEPLRRPSYKIGLKLMKPTSMVKVRPRQVEDHQTAIRRIRQLSAPQVVTGRERRRINPNQGCIKLLERNVDMVVSRFLYPHLSRIWNPYSWLLQSRFSLATASVSFLNWPRDLAPTRVLLISDIHSGL